MGCSFFPDKLFARWRWARELTALSDIHDVLYARKVPREMSDGIWRDLCIAMSLEVRQARKASIDAVQRDLRHLDYEYPGLWAQTVAQIVELSRLAERPAKGRLWWIGQAGYSLLRKYGWFAYWVKPALSKLAFWRSFSQVRD